MYRDPDTGFPKKILFVGKLKLYKNLVRKRLEKKWYRVYEGTKIIEWTEIEYQAQTWSMTSRIILIRMAEASDFEEPYLSEDFLWEYRASMKNYIKEIKNGFASDQVSGDDFSQISLTYGLK